MRQILLALALIATPAAAQHTPVMKAEHDAFTALASTAETVITGSVTYSTPTAAQFIRVEGHLTVAAALDVDTILVMPGGTLEVLAGATITIRDMGPIDTVRDPARLSRGIVSHGDLIMSGSAKDGRARVLVDPMAGDNVLVLEAAPTNWGVGDVVVIAGTSYDGHQYDGYHLPEDEVRQIVAIQGNEIFLDQPLVRDHAAPRPDLKTWVGNYSRSITIRTENGAALPPGQRGHVMCMHAGCTVHGVLLEHMGRTDKSIPLDAVNVSGRYPLHCHRSPGCDFEGNAVWTSPGWGIVDHDSTASVIGNVTYDTFGAGFMAESGNEIGVWADNLAIYAKGRSWRSAKDANFDGHEAYDLGTTGDGFVLHGRQIVVSGNVAASVNHGFVFYHRGKFGDGMAMNFDAMDTAFPAAFWYGSRPPDRHPILGFDGNEVFAARVGLVVDKALQNQGHDVHTTMTGFRAWNVRNGALLGYTGHYTLTDFDVRGIGQGDGIALGTNTIDMTLVRPRVEGFLRGLNAHKNFTTPPPDPTRPGIAVIDATVTGNGTDLVNLLPEEVLSGATVGTLSVTLDPMTWTGTGCLCITITGTVTDSLGTRPLPTQGDTIRIALADMLAILANAGWWDTADGRRVVLLPFYASDRLTGGHQEFVAEIEIDAGVNLAHPAYSGAVYNGTLPSEPTVEELLAQIAVLEAQSAALVADLNTALSTIAQLEARISAAVQALTGP